MSWVFSQSDGLLSSGSVSFKAYAGQPPYVNDPGAEHMKNQGPLPRGRYTMVGPPYDTVSHGPAVIALEPDPKNEMHGRSGFLIHDDSVSRPGFASQGCVVVAGSRSRWRIWDSGDRVLEVVWGSKTGSGH